MSDGNKANKTGSMAENLVESVLNEKYQLVKQYNYGKSIYDTDLYCDFFIPTHNTIIEVKWQQSAGSVDEKFPFLVANLKKHQYKSIVIVDGGGQKPGSIEWLKAQVDEKLIGVFTITEFIKYINNGGFDNADM